MPCKITWFENGVKSAYSGHVTGADILGSIMSIFGEARFDEVAFQVADLTEIKSAQVTEREMKKAAYIDRAASQSNPNLKVAIIASTQLSQQIAQQYIDHSADSPWEIQMFGNLAEAETWLPSKRLLAS